MYGNKVSWKRYDDERERQERLVNVEQCALIWLGPPWMVDVGAILRVSFVAIVHHKNSVIHSF